MADLNKVLASSASSKSKAKQSNASKKVASYWSTAPQPRWIDKVVPDRIFSLAVHPTAEKLLVAVGDKWGRLGLWVMLKHT